ncbi:hypothetical protein NPIL_406531 [Nephila pilipes]|uniref:Uncharacterized protein n=1 Tax=Nephila pilipes TaxID=299642 RepID=A0A8X6MVA9_NEPPI|nr:hypothetical protein NPIL_406531 [Nephila pilipes]
MSENGKMDSLDIFLSHPALRTILTLVHIVKTRYDLGSDAKQIEGSFKSVPKAATIVWRCYPNSDENK